MIYIVQLDDGDRDASVSNVVATTIGADALKAADILRAWIAKGLAYEKEKARVEPTAYRLSPEYTEANPCPFPSSALIGCWYVADKWRVIIDGIPVYADQG